MSKNYKIAVIADIHSNYAALKAVMDEMSSIGVDDILAAGDFIGGFVQPNETIEIISGSGAKAIYGNRENYLRDYISGKHNDWSLYHQMLPVVWTDKALKQENKKYLMNLPMQQKFSVCGFSFRMVHGSLRQVDELIFKHEAKKIKEALACAEENILICGHNHQQWHATMDGTLIVNPGSVGLSFIKGGRASYSILSFDGISWSVEEKTVQYNTDEVQIAFDKSGIDNYSAWENMLMHSIKDGKVATIAFLDFAKHYAKSKGWDESKTNGLIPNEYWDEADRIFDWKNIDCEKRVFSG